jgi:hypothetical protein
MSPLAAVPLGSETPGPPPKVATACTPQAAAALIATQFRAYNEEFGRITRRAADHFL